MITGIYDALNGAFITASVYFPAPVDEFLLISFLVDTGATQSCVGITDLLRLTPEGQKNMPTQRSQIEMRGIGGSIIPSTTLAGIGFTHDDGQTTMFALSLSLIDETEAAGLPALLGRDILFRGDLIFDPAAGRVVFDLPVGSFWL